MGESVSTHGWVDKPNRSLAGSEASIVNKSDQRSDDWRRGRGSEYKTKCSINSNNVVGSAKNNKFLVSMKQLVRQRLTRWQKDRGTL